MNHVEYKQWRIQIHPKFFDQEFFEETMFQLGATQLTPNKYFIRHRFGVTTIFLGSLIEGDWNIYIQGGLNKKNLAKKICSKIYPKIKLIR